MLTHLLVLYCRKSIRQSTRSYHKNKPETSAVPVEQNNSQAVNPFVARPMMDSFAPNKGKEDKKMFLSV